MWSVIRENKGSSKLFGLQGEPPSLFPFYIATFWSPHKKKSAEGTWFAYYNDFEKKEWEYFFSKQEIYHM